MHKKSKRSISFIVILTLIFLLISQINVFAADVPLSFYIDGFSYNGHYEASLSATQNIMNTSDWGKFTFNVKGATGGYTLIIKDMRKFIGYVPNGTATEIIMGPGAYYIIYYPAESVSYNRTLTINAVKTTDPGF